MSRSKKRPYWTDYAKGQKSWASRRFRKKVKQILHLQAKGDDEPEFPHPKWMTNPATVCDFRFYAPWDARAYRK
jgi:hypothetical protein